MEETNPVEQEIVIRGVRCKVTATLVKKLWNASGMYAGQLVKTHRAKDAKQAFEWWKNKADMEQRSR